MHIGIIGNGYVGRGTRIAFSSSAQRPDIITYDIDSNLCDPAGTSFDELLDCDLVFICVPTPMRTNGECDVSIVKNVVTSLIDAGYRKDCIVVRSTVPVGTCESLEVNFMPEFLTERNWEDDSRNCQYFVVGADSMKQHLIKRLRSFILYTTEIYMYTTREAELIKYVRNAFLATKVSFFNEIASFCEASEIDYDMVRSGVVLDERIGQSHTMVPGPDGKKGYGGTCFPKDMSSLQFQFSESQIPCFIIESAQKRNVSLDRAEKDWELDIGRAVI